MKKGIVAFLILVLTGCGSSSWLSRYPAEDKQVYDLVSKAGKKSADPSVFKQLAEQYNIAIDKHLQNIAQYKAGTTDRSAENIMAEYSQLNKLAEAVENAGAGIQPKRYNAEYNQAKSEVVQQHYTKATTLLNTGNRQDAQEAYDLLQKVQSLSPGYGNANKLAQQALQQSTISVVINPVDYYSQSFSAWGFNNDYIQQEMVRDLRYQFSSNDVKFYTDWEARSQKIYPDRVVDLRWEELFIPVPFDQSFQRQVSKQIVVGQTEDKKPIYNTVYATVYITRRTVQSRGNLVCRITEPATNRVLLYDNIPASHNWVEEYGSYQGDSRALSNYDWAIMNRGSFRDPSRGDFLNNIFRQAYPQLLNRIRSVTW
jgi:hypothetical protein